MKEPELPVFTEYLKVLVIGGKETGKSALKNYYKKFCDAVDDDEETEIGMISVPIHDNSGTPFARVRTTFQFSETSQTAEFTSGTYSKSQYPDVILFVYDLNSSSSTDFIDLYVPEFTLSITNCFFLVGNKIDLTMTENTDSTRALDTWISTTNSLHNSSTLFREKYCGRYFISTSTGLNVDQLFLSITQIGLRKKCPYLKNTDCYIKDKHILDAFMWWKKRNVILLWHLFLKGRAEEKEEPTPLGHLMVGLFKMPPEIFYKILNYLWVQDPFL
eukprot:TRINITY_DN22985_c0_g1_i1.p1 TRINITY_DN22985_c0_g1~~TRINITY_DN22985_c0_g1_i1.p1  ORF type:complete len:274 (-),score=54.02 TRINITY_DN22985_c0_g1_i1:14-835(-)